MFVLAAAVPSSLSLLLLDGEQKSKSTTMELPVETASLTFAPNVPPPINRSHSVRLVVNMDTQQLVMPVSPISKYNFWTFNNHVPGPFIRARVNDVLEVHFTNRDQNGIGHNIDFHCVTGPGGGAPVLNAEEGEEKVGTFRLLYPGLFLYHCASAPVPAHIANGMFGLILVEPEGGLPKVDREFYVMQHEIYSEEGESEVLEYSHTKGLMEHPSHVVFNGREGALTDAPLKVNQHESVRLFFGNAGPNLASSFHIIGAIFDKVYREADLISPPARGIQTTLVPAGSAVVVELAKLPVPGNLTLVDHSIFRIEKGAIGFLKVAGNEANDIYTSRDFPNPCVGCKLHN